MVRAEPYIKAFPNKRLSDHKPRDINEYLKGKGRVGGIQDWQFRQIVDAIQNMFAMLNPSWFSEVDLGRKTKINDRFAVWNRYAVDGLRTAARAGY